jgi:hypothetical protein
MRLSLKMPAGSKNIIDMTTQWAGYPAIVIFYGA